MKMKKNAPPPFTTMVTASPKAFSFTGWAEEVFHIKEMFYLNQEAETVSEFRLRPLSMVYWVKGDIYKNEPWPFTRR